VFLRFDLNATAAIYVFSFPAVLNINVHGGCKRKNVNQKKYQKMMTAAIVLIVLFGMSAQAETSLKEWVVKADRIGQDQATVSAAMTVIHRQDIERSQARTVAELLRVQAGIDVASSGGAGKTTSVFLRGGNSGHVLVLVDGVRVGSATTGQFDWAHVSTSDIERIEIVRGAQSSLYGADAMAGVIQIFTQRGKKETQVSIQSDAGSYATSTAAMRVKGQTKEGVSYALSVDMLRTAGVSAAAKGSESDPYRQSTVSASVVFPWQKGELALGARSVEGKTSLDGGFPLQDVLNYTNHTKQSVTHVKLSYFLSDRIESRLQFSRANDESIGHDPVTAFNNSDFRTQVDQLTWQNHVDLDDISILLGADLYRSRGLSHRAKLDRQIQQKAGFMVVSWDQQTMHINASIRYDHHSASKNKTTYKAGFALYPTDNFKIIANYATGFKAPSLNDLYFPASAFSAGNANLKAESSQGWDVGLAYQYQRDAVDCDVSFTWFQQNYSNLIVWQGLAPTFFYTPSNIGQAQAKGLEVQATLRYAQSYVQANWTFLNAKDTASGDLLPRRAKESANVTLGTKVSGIDMVVAWHLVGPRFSSAGQQKYMQGYQTTDVRLQYALGEHWKLVARVNNVANKKYEEVASYGVLGRAWYGGLNTDF